jgi:hypothetical protein
MPRVTAALLILQLLSSHCPSTRHPAVRIAPDL